MRISLQLIALLLLTSAAGCFGGGEGSSAEAYDAERARTVLVTVLDAWKEGRAKSLAKEMPPIRFVDDDYSAGHSLVSYSLAAPEDPIEEFADVPVVLTIADARGTQSERKATYQIVLHPTPAVLRSDS